MDDHHMGPGPAPSEGPAAALDFPNVQKGDCPHCGEQTMHCFVTDEHGNAWPPDPTAPDQNCLQCIADGATCCTLNAFNRHGL